MEELLWEKDYTEAELRTGYLLYKDGHIRSKIKRGAIYTVKISSYYYETVTVDTTGSKYRVDCDCWDYRYHKKCEHCVAALYAVTLKPEELSYQDQQKIMPFCRAKQNKSEYHYFDMEKIAGQVGITNHTYELGKRLVEEHELSQYQVLNFPYQTEAGGGVKNGLKLTLSKDVAAREKGAAVVLQVGKDFLWSAECNMRRCYCKLDYYATQHRSGGSLLCEHMVAALICLEQYIEKENPGDATDDRGRRFLQRFRKKVNAPSEKTQTVKLIPELINEDGDFKVGFKIGIDKLYKVKNLTELVTIVQNNETLALGKNNSVNFSLFEFEEEARPFFDFIHSRVRDNLQRIERIEARNRWGYTDSAWMDKIKDTIPLSGSAMDDFYQLCKGKNEIDYVCKSYYEGTARGKIQCAEGKPKVNMTIKELRERRQVEGIQVIGELPELCQGAQGVYFVHNHTLYQTSKEDYENLMPFMELADSEGRFSFHVGRRNLAEFYYSVYPLLKQVADVTDNALSKIEDIIPPAPEIVFYLDSIDNVLYCRTEIAYGVLKHSPMESRGVNGFSQIYRDFAKEREICHVVEDYFPSYDEAKDEAYCEDADACYRVYREGVDELLKYGEIQCTDRFRNRKVRSNTGIKVGVSVESDLLNLTISSSDLSRDELYAIFQSYRLKKKYYVLSNGDFVDLQSPDIEMMDQILTACKSDLKNLIGDKLQVPMYRALYLDRLLEDNEELYGHRDKNFRRLIKDFGTVKDSDLEVPGSLEEVLRPYQVFGHRWLRTLIHNHFGGILADEMGLGKTLQMISVLLAEQDVQGENRKTALIVCPASLVYNWKEEFHRFAPRLKVETVACGVSQRREQIKHYNSADVLITSYELLKRDIALYQDCHFEYQILDEAQVIKNPKTVAAKTVKVIDAANRFALTGTPIENRLSELWSIFDYLMPGFLYDYETFRRELEVPIAKDKNEEASARLKKMIAPFILRRRKMDVLKDLPDKLEEIRYGVMEEKQQKLYDSHIMRISKQVEQEDEAEFSRNKLKLLAEITRARQLCCDPSLVVEGYTGGSAKREACLELIQSAIEGEHRMLLFSQFTTMLDLIARDLADNGISYYVLTGSTPKEERVRLMREFNEGQVPVFLISLKAGGTGLNLTGADVVIHYDPWWNLAVQNQATDRAHRIGQTKNVTVYKLIIKDSIEEKIVKLQESKKDLAEEILNGENGTLSSLSKEDLLALLG